MKKKLSILLAATLIMLCSIVLLTVTVTAEEKEITISYMNSDDNVFGTDKLDEKAYEGGTQTVKAGEKFTLPTTSGATVPDEKTYTLVWYTSDGRTYDAGDSVCFYEDTQLYRVAAYNVSSFDLLKTAVVNGTYAARLTCDIDGNSTIGTKGEAYSRIFLNGYNLNISGTNNNVLSAQRGGKLVMGTGKLTYTGTGSIIDMNSHFYNGGKNIAYIGKDVTVDAPNALFAHDNNGDTTAKFPKVYIYGTVNVKNLVAINNGNNEAKDPEIYIFDGATVTVSDSYLAKRGSSYVYEMYVYITGGTIHFNSDTADAFSDSSIFYTITGGQFSLNSTDSGKLAELIDSSKKIVQITNNGITYDCVVDKDCEHNYVAGTVVQPTCEHGYYLDHICGNCGDSIRFSWGDKIQHNYVYVTDKVVATPLTTGIKVYKCSLCEDETERIYSFDPSNIQINVTVIDGEKEKVITLNAGDVIDFTANGSDGAYTYSVSGLKAFDKYGLDSIVGITISQGITTIEFTQDAPALKEINIADNAVVEIKKFSTLSALEVINVGKSTVTFETGCANKTIQSIRSEVEGANILFKANAFLNVTSLTELKMSTNSTYEFQNNSFKQSGLTELVFPDYCNPIFRDEAAFYKCNSLKYIYIGRGKTTLEGKPFDYCQYVEKVVLMEVTSISKEWTFCVQNMTQKPVEYYIHSSSISLPNNTFGQGKGIVIYTNAPITNGNAFNSCSGITYNGVEYPAYTIYYGIPHNLTEANEEPTCEENGVNGYKTDCPCGAQLEGSVTVQKFSAALTNSNNFEEITYTSTVIPATGHKEGTVVGIAYENGYMLAGTKTCICETCSEEYVEETASSKPLFTWLGYSMPEDGELKLAIGFMIDTEAIELYETINKTTVEYGVVAAIADKLNGKAPLDENLTDANVVNTPVDKEYCSIEFKVFGFTDEQLDLELVMSMYVTENGKLVYLQENQTDMPSTISINKYLELIKQ